MTGASHCSHRRHRRQVSIPRRQAVPRHSFLANVLDPFSFAASSFSACGPRTRHAVTGRKPHAVIDDSHAVICHARGLFTAFAPDGSLDLRCGQGNRRARANGLFRLKPADAPLEVSSSRLDSRLAGEILNRERAEEPSNSFREWMPLMSRP